MTHNKLNINHELVNSRVNNNRLINRYEEYNFEEDGDGGVEQISFTYAEENKDAINTKSRAGEDERKSNI